MYVSLGGDVVVAVRDVIAILDGRAVGGSELSREFIRRVPRLGGVPVSGPVPGARGGVSWVVTSAGVYASGFSPATLARRMTQFAEHANSWRPQTSGRTRGLRV